MSFIIRDFLSPTVFNFNTNSVLYERFRKAWGGWNGTSYTRTVWVNGKECFQKQYRYYEGGTFKSTTNDKQFYKVLGTSYEELYRNKPSSSDEVEYMYFELVGKMFNFSPASKQAIADYINLNMAEEVTVTVDYGGALQKYLKLHEKGYTLVESPDGDWTKSILEVNDLNKEDIVAELDRLPWLYYANIAEYDYIANTEPYNDENAFDNSSYQTYYDLMYETPVTQVTASNRGAIFAMYDDGSNFEQIGDIFDDRTYTVTIGLPTDETPDLFGDPTYITTQAEALGYKFSRKYKFTPLTISSHLVTEIYNKLQNMEQARTPTYNFYGNLIPPIPYTRLKAADALAKKYMYDMSDEVEDNELWQRGHLTVAGAEDLKRWEFADLFSKTFKSDYKIEDASTWEKILGVVIVIVAIVVAVVVAIYCTACAAAAYPALAAAAAGAAAAAIVLSVGGLILSAVGGPSAGKIVKIIGRFAQIVGIIAMVLGIANWITTAYNSYKEAARLAAVESGKLGANEAFDYGIDQFMSDLVDSMLDSVVDAWNFMGDLFTGNIEASPIQLNDVSGFVDNMNTAFKVYNEFFNKYEPVDSTLQEQTDKSNQFPEDQWLTMEMTVYEPDALQKMDLLKEQSTGGNQTQAFLDKIA